MYVVGESSDAMMVVVHDGVRGDVSSLRGIGDVNIGDRVLTATGGVANVTGFGLTLNRMASVVRIYLGPPGWENRGERFDLPAELRVLVRRDVPYDRLSDYARGFCSCMPRDCMPRGKFFTPPVWVPARDLTTRDHICLPHHGKPEVLESYYELSSSELQRIDGETSEVSSLDDRLYKRPWWGEELGPATLYRDRVGIYFPIARKVLAKRNRSWVSMSVSSIGSIVVNTLAVRARCVPIGVPQDA